jgi:formamidopyrimidine-DNA glycosylase
MPELPEVETVRSELSEFLSDVDLLNVKSPTKLQLRKPVLWPSKKLKVKDVNRWGKRLFLELNNNAYFDVSLGMTGSFRREKKYSFKDHDHLVFELGDHSNLVYNDPRRFGWVQYRDGKPVTKGWDPIIGNPSEKEWVVKKMKTSRKDVYSFLMDQSHIVGLGNIYVQEALFRAGVRPFKRCFRVSYAKLYFILEKVEEVLLEALSFKGTTIISYKSAKGESGGFQNRLRVYGKSEKDRCLVCSSPLKKIKKARSVTYCRLCQK